MLPAIHNEEILAGVLGFKYQCLLSVSLSSLHITTLICKLVFLVYTLYLLSQLRCSVSSIVVAYYIHTNTFLYLLTLHIVTGSLAAPME